MYLAITQATCEWLLARSGLLDALHQEIVSSPVQSLSLLTNQEFAAESVRLAGAPGKTVLGLWNKDYLSGSGEEPWGFIRIAGPFSLEKYPSISREVFERAIYVINQRLQGLLIDGAYIHRSYPNGTHTCLAGRGSEARQVSIGYFEDRTTVGVILPNAIVIIGPEFNFTQLSDEAYEAGLAINSLYRAANALLLPTRTTPLLASDKLEGLRHSIEGYAKVKVSSFYDGIEAIPSEERIDSRRINRALGLSYSEWLNIDSPLSGAQRRVLESGALDRHPLRIIGPAGSGKTILMQLLALKVINDKAVNGARIRVLYLVHNAPMVRMVEERFDMLDPDGSIREKGSLLVKTLSTYSSEQIGLEVKDLINQEAQDAKEFQLEEISSSLSETLRRRALPEDSVFRNALGSDELAIVLARLVASEISIAIKGHGLENDRRRYVESERKFSRLHGALKPHDREVLFDIFEEYRARVFNGYGVLDSDDVALSLLGQLRTPVWELRRKDSGFDYVFVDETQMFNDNERRLFPLLSNGSVNHVPIALALDEAQDPHGMVASGMAALGIKDVANESMESIHRSTAQIVDLAFFLIQQTTDLFGVDFPDFTQAVTSVREDGASTERPRIETAGADRVGKSVLRRIRELRSKNIWRIAVVCFTDHYFDNVRKELAGEGKDLPRYELLRRGERLPLDAPMVVLTRPEFVGGQEFDAVVAVGLEQGVMPPRVIGNAVLAAAIEQQLLRELYITVSRARARVIFVMSKGALPSQILVKAVGAGLLDYDGGTQQSLL